MSRALHDDRGVKIRVVFSLRSVGQLGDTRISGLFSSRSISPAPCWTSIRHIWHSNALSLCLSDFGWSFEARANAPTWPGWDVGWVQGGRGSHRKYINMPWFTYTAVFPLSFYPCSALGKLGCSGSTCFHVEAGRYDDLCHMDLFTGGIKIPPPLDDAW